jgi:hypothetical protein
MRKIKAILTGHELSQAGWEALVVALGPANATRFVLQYERGSGDYVKLREKLFGQKTVDELYNEMKSRKKR